MDEWPEPILHVDMDAFFVECERLRRPELVGIPVAVGGSSARSVVAAASYEARSFGVFSAMPTAAARRRCPHLTLVAPDHAEYSRVSELVFDVFRSFTPLVEGLSLDEAFLDVSGLRRHYPQSSAVAESIRSRIRKEIGLPSSVGIAASKFVAKLASARAKPDGILHVARLSQVEFIHSLPLRALWGVGPATQAALARIGIDDIPGLARTDLATLSRAVGEAGARHLLALTRGSDDRAVEPLSESKSVSAEETFETDLEAGAVLDHVLRRQADQVASRLRRGGLRARTVTVKIRFADFSTITRAETLSSSTSNDVEIYRTAQRLFHKAVAAGTPIRLLGLGTSGFEPEAANQLGLALDGGREQLDHAIDAIRDKFGSSTIGPASSA